MSMVSCTSSGVSSGHPMMMVAAGNQWFWFSMRAPSRTTLPHSSGANGFVFTPRCFLTIFGATVSIPRLVASHLPVSCCLFMVDIWRISSGSEATAENVMCVVPTKLAPRPLSPDHRSVMASLFGIKSRLSHPYSSISSECSHMESKP